MLRKGTIDRSLDDISANPANLGEGKFASHAARNPAPYFYLYLDSQEHDAEGADRDNQRSNAD